MLRQVLAPIHPDGWRFVAIFAVVTLVLFWIAEPLGWLGLAATGWCVYFFRDPWRFTPVRSGIAVAPADGVVALVDRAPPPEELEMGAEPMLRIAIFLSVLDVHVNRMPLGGRVVKRVYRPGKFFNASLDKASVDNERMSLRLAEADGGEAAVVQIAGLIARRIRCDVDAGQDVIAGQRFGLIRFGSRTELYLPAEWSPWSWWASAPWAARRCWPTGAPARARAKGRSIEMRPREMLRRRRRRRRVKGRPLAGWSINILIPNILTLLALCAGMTAIRFAVAERFEAAVLAIMVAGVLDGLDGRIARLLKGTSTFGAQLDSLSDFVSFGVAPAVMLYLWTMGAMQSVGWALVLLFAVCCGLRLARFNTQIGANLPSYASNFFTGVPAPAAAGLVLVPMLLSFEFDSTLFRSPVVNGVWLACVAALMVSRVPTYSLKRFHVQRQWVLPTLLAIGLIAAFFTTEPWATLLAIGFIYIGSMPVSLWQYLRRRAAVEQRREPRELAPPATDPYPPPERG